MFCTVGEGPGRTCMPTPPEGCGTASCRLLVLPQVNLPSLTPSTWVAHEYPRTGSLGIGMIVLAWQLKALLFCVWVYVSVCECVYLIYCILLGPFFP